VHVFACLRRTVVRELPLDRRSYFLNAHANARTRRERFFDEQLVRVRRLFQRGKEVGVHGPDLDSSASFQRCALVHTIMHVIDNHPVLAEALDEERTIRRTVVQSCVVPGSGLIFAQVDLGGALPLRGPAKLDGQHGYQSAKVFYVRVSRI
jgi:hypothetical protein